MKRTYHSVWNKESLSKSKYLAASFSFLFFFFFGPWDAEILFFLFFLLFLGPLPQHMEVPRLGVESEL